MLTSFSKPWLLGCGALTALTFTSWTLAYQQRDAHWAAHKLAPIPSSQPPSAAQLHAAPPQPLPQAPLPATDRWKQLHFVDEHAVSVRTTRVVLKEVQKAQEDYEAKLGKGDLLDGADLKAWQRVKRTAQHAMKAVHRFAAENLAMWETVIQRLEDDLKEELTWEEAMEGYSFEERVSWLQRVYRQIDLCLDSHRAFRHRLVTKYQQRLDQEDAALQQKWKQVLSAAGLAVASLVTLAALYSYRTEEGSRAETVRSYLFTTAFTELTSQAVSGAKLFWECCTAEEGPDRVEKEAELKSYEARLKLTESDMVQASAHLLAADVRYEQLCCKSRTGQSQPGMRLGRKDLVPALRRLISQELRPLISLCAQYSLF